MPFRISICVVPEDGWPGVRKLPASGIQDTLVHSELFFVVLGHMPWVVQRVCYETQCRLWVDSLAIVFGARPNTLIIQRLADMIPEQQVPSRHRGSTRSQLQCVDSLVNVAELSAV